VSQKRSPWVVVLLVLSVVAFIGISIIPLLGNISNDTQTSAEVTPTPTSTISAEDRSELEAQAKGYELVVQREPDNVTALRGLLEVRLQLGDIKGAIAPLEKLAKLNPEQTDYGVLLAQARQQSGDLEGAAQAYRNILTSQPGDMNALQGLVSLLVQQNRPEAAIGLLQDTLKTATQVNEIQPGTVDIISVQLLLGQVYANEQRYNEALAIYDQSIETNEQDFRPLLAKALILKQQGRIGDAQPLFAQAVSLAPARYKDQVKQLAGEASAPTSSPTTEENPDRRETPTSPGS